MQLDMHDHGTCAMARAAGLTGAAAKMIATCARFVDDNVAKGGVEFRGGTRIDAEATAHRSYVLRDLLPHHDLIVD